MSTALSSPEQRVVGLIRQLPSAAVQEVYDFVVFLAARHCGWSYDDRAALERAVDLMACDQFVSREIRAVNEDFACTETARLEPYP